MPIPSGLPPTWAIVVAILTVLIGGLTWVTGSLLKERREAKLQPAVEEAQRLANEEKAQEIAEMLRESQRAAVADIRALLVDARAEAAEARKEAAAARKEAAQLRTELDTVREAHRLDRASAKLFRERVEELLSDAGVAIPPWWHEGA